MAEAMVCRATTVSPSLRQFEGDGGIDGDQSVDDPSGAESRDRANAGGTFLTYFPPTNRTDDSIYSGGFCSASTLETIRIIFKRKTNENYQIGSTRFRSGRGCGVGNVG